MANVLAQNPGDNRASTYNDLHSAEAEIISATLNSLKTPGDYHNRQTMIYHDGVAFVNARGQSLPSLLTLLRKRPGLRKLTESNLKTVYHRLKESPIALIGSPEQSILSVLYKQDLINQKEMDQLQALAKLHKKAESKPYVTVHNRIWNLTELPAFEELSALDREIRLLLTKLNIVKNDVVADQSRNFRLLYGSHLVKSNGLSFNNSAALNKYIDERTKTAFMPPPMVSFSKLVKSATLNHDVVNTFYEGNGGKDLRKKTTSNFLHMMDILNGNDNHTYRQQTAFRNRYSTVANKYNASLVEYLSLQAKELLRKEGVKEINLHDILDGDGRLLAVPSHMDDLPRFYQLYGGRGWDGAAPQPYAGNTVVQTRWGRKLDVLTAHYRAKTDAELDQAARKAEWEQFGIDVLHHIPFAGSLFGLTEASLSGNRLGVIVSGLGLATDYASFLVPSLLEIKAADEAAESVISSAIRGSDKALETRMAARVNTRSAPQTVIPAGFSRLAVGEMRSWTHPHTNEYLVVTRLVDQEVVALRSKAGGGYIQVDFSTGKPNYAKVIFKNEHGHLYRGGLKGGANVPLKARINVSNKYVLNQVDNDGYEFELLYEPSSEHYLVADVVDGVMNFAIKSNPATQNFGSGRDMFISLMQRLRREKIAVNKIRAVWLPDKDASVNYASYMDNIAKGMSKINAAHNTWTGKRAVEYGYTHVEHVVVDDRTGQVSALFTKPIPLTKLRGPAPDIDVSANFISHVDADNNVNFKYIANQSHAIRGNVKSRTLSFEIDYNPNEPHLGSERDMFISALRYLHARGIVYNKIKLKFLAEGLTTDRNSLSSFNAYYANKAAGMSIQEAAFNTQAGQLAAEFDFGRVGEIKDNGGEVAVVFERQSRARKSNGAASHRM